MKRTVLVMGVMIAPEARAFLEAHDCRVVATAPEFEQVAACDVLRQIDPDAIILRKGRLDAETLGAARRLKAVAKHGVGFDTIDVAAATALGVPVFVTTGANAVSVAEHALALTLCTLKNINHLDTRIRSGHWDKATHRGFELTGKTVGLIGYGRIATAFAAMLAPFSVRIEALVRDPAVSRARTPANATPPVNFTDNLPAFLASADIVSLHCPLTPATRGIIDANAIDAMRPGAVLINTARGGLVEEDALIAGLDGGRLWGAGLDCLADEPPLATSRLLDHPRVTLTPHIAWATNEAARAMGLSAARSVVDALDGQPLAPEKTVNLIDLPDLMQPLSKSA